MRDDGRDVEWVDLQGQADPDVIDTSPPSRNRLPRWTLALLAIPVALIATLVMVGTQGGGHRGLSGTASHSVRGTTTPNEHPTHTSSFVASSTPPPPPSPPKVVVTDFGHPLLGITSSYELFIRASDSMVRIEFARGKVTRTTLDPINSGGGVAFMATDSGAIIRPMDNVTGYLVPDGKPARPLENLLNRSGLVFPGPEVGQIWVQTDNETMSLVDGRGRRTGASVRFPGGGDGAWQLQPDGSGNLLFAGIGGLYELSDGSPQRVMSGTLEATGPTRWLSTECDERYRCATVVIDKRSLSRHTVGGGLRSTGYNTTGMISPDGSTAVMFPQTNESSGIPVSQVHLLDLNTGRDHALGLKVNIEQAYPGAAGGPVVWSPDSRWLFAIDDAGQLVRIDPISRHVDDVELPLPELLTQLAIRP